MYVDWASLPGRRGLAPCASYELFIAPRFVVRFAVDQSPDSGRCSLNGLESNDASKSRREALLAALLLTALRADPGESPRTSNSRKGASCQRTPVLWKTSLGRAAVASYMRLATGLRAGRLLTACPSEPLLALAAAVAIQEKLQRIRGRSGLGGRPVRKARPDHGPRHGHSPRLRRSHPLATFLAASYPSRHAGVAPRASLDNIGDEVILPHTHFLELEADVAILDAQWCFEMLCRGAAQCTPVQPVIDGIPRVRGRARRAVRRDQTASGLLPIDGRRESSSRRLGGCKLDLSAGAVQGWDIGQAEAHSAAHRHGRNRALRSKQLFLHSEERAATVPTGHGKSWNAYCAAHLNMVEPIGQFIGIRGLEPYAVLQLEDLDLGKLQRTMSPEGPLGTTFELASRQNYYNLTTGVCQRS
ncbi:hypothetical protein B0H14DRAFT_2577648 [Mycena olivaceomarginata]|nr:hypothetical protein B0H14DRAFT_2577648 [Mycena olivaceomarginata]